MAKTASKPLPTDPAERLALGKKLHEKHWPTNKDAAAALGIREHNLYVVLKEFRDSENIVTPNMTSSSRRRTRAIGNLPDDQMREHRNAIKRRSAEKRKAEKEAARSNSTNGHLVRLPLAPDVAQFQNRIIELERHNSELQSDLAHTLEEMQTLQKLLMTVGRTL